MLDDLFRIAAIQAIIHVMFVAEGRETLFARKTIALLLYTCLGVAFYHLMVRKLVRVSSKPREASI